jgi:hypothetical protein
VQGWIAAVAAGPRACGRTAFEVLWFADLKDVAASSRCTTIDGMHGRSRTGQTVVGMACIHQQLDDEMLLIDGQGALHTNLIHSPGVTLSTRHARCCAKEDRGMQKLLRCKQICDVALHVMKSML